MSVVSASGLLLGVDTPLLRKILVIRVDFFSHGWAN